jgi:hypothetical protein
MTDTGARTIAAGVPDRTARLVPAALFAGALGISFAPVFVRLSEAGPSATAFWRMTLALALPLLRLWTGQAGSGDASGRQALSSGPETLRGRRSCWAASCSPIAAGRSEARCSSCWTAKRSEGELAGAAEHFQAG